MEKYFDRLEACSDRPLNLDNLIVAVDIGAQLMVLTNARILRNSLGSFKASGRFVVVAHGVSFLFSAFFSQRLAVRRDGYFAMKGTIPCHLLVIFFSAEE